MIDRPNDGGDSDQFVAGKHSVDDFVFPNKGGCPYERVDGAGQGSGQDYFGQVVEAAGRRGVVMLRSLRHLFAVRLLTRGVPITVVSELLGPSNIQITVKRYGCYASDAKVKWDAVRVLDGVSATPPPAAPGRKLVAIEGGKRGRLVAEWIAE